jgi:hypothetical protein
MTWRTANWMLWTLLAVLVLLGSLGVIGRELAWVAFLVAGLAELVALLQPATAAVNSEKSVELTAEMVRTQDRGYDRAVRRLRSGGRIRYEQVELQIQSDRLFCRGPASRSVNQDERLARQELERLREQLNSLCRKAPELDVLRRDKRLRLTLLDPKKLDSKKKDPTSICALEDGHFRWTSHPPAPLIQTSRDGPRPA